MNRASPLPASRSADRLISSNESFADRCCDWHWGDAGGRGDRTQPCQGERYPGRAKATCSCDESKALRERIEVALMLLRGGFVERARGVLEGET
jgi:hypothetical protein